MNTLKLLRLSLDESLAVTIKWKILFGGSNPCKIIIIFVEKCFWSF